MADGLYIGMAGAAARAEQLDSIADNLANAQTPGFKAARPAFESFLPRGAGPGADKVSTAAVATGVDLRPGATVTTGNPLDALPEEGAFLAVRLADGRVGYTRAGHLTLSADGQLEAGGRPLLDRSGEPLLVPPDSRVALDADGQVLADGEVLGELSRASLSGPMERAGPALFVPAPNGGAARPSEARLQLGVVELSNVPPMEAAVQMISAQRHFDTSMQALQTYRRLDERASEVGRVR